MHPAGPEPEPARELHQRLQLAAAAAPLTPRTRAKPIDSRLATSYQEVPDEWIFVCEAAGSSIPGEVWTPKRTCC
jgi:hypothetical protein